MLYYFFSLSIIFSRSQKYDRKKMRERFTIYKLSDKIYWWLIHIENTTVYFYPDHIMTTTAMSTMIVAFVIAALCQVGTMAEEEKVSLQWKSSYNIEQYFVIEWNVRKICFLY
jgi:hypothetical protein